MIDVKIDLNKSLHSFSNRVKVRQGDVGEKMRITLTDNKLSLENQNNLQVKFEGNVQSGDYVEGIANQYNEDAGKFIYQFKSEDVSITGPYQRAFIRVYDENGNKISSEEIFVEVLKDADISNAQATVYVSKLDNLVENLDEEFDHFLTGKKEDYAILDKKNNELDSKLVELQKGTNKIEQTQTEILQSIDEHKLVTKNELEVAKEESSANVIYQLIGKENFEMTFTMDFKEKVRGSVNENPNTLFGLGTTTLPQPAEMTTEVVQERYTAISEIDGNTVNSSITDNAYFPKFGAKWNLVEHVKKVLGEEYFFTLGATTLAQQVDLLRAKITRLSGNLYAYGHSPNGYKVSMGSWLRTTNAWEPIASHTSDTISKLTIDIDKPMISNYIDDNGFFYTLVYSDPSDGKTATRVVMDYTNVVFTMGISANEHIKSMIAANRVENLATQEEAVMGEDNTKTMTPLRVNEALENKAVSIAGNQTVGGIKNFRDGLLLNDIPLSSITRKVVYEADGIGGYFNQSDKFILGVSEKIDRVVLLWSRVDDVGGTLLNYSWSQTVLSPDDIILGYSYRLQLTNENYKFVTFANEMGKITISGANENSVAPNRIYRIKRIISYIKD